MAHANPVRVPVTGQTPFYSTMMQPWAAQNCFERDIESYCLDAPHLIPSGAVRSVCARVGLSQALGVSRD